MDYIEGEISYGEKYEKGWQDYMRVFRQSNPMPIKPGFFAGWDSLLTLMAIIAVAGVLLTSSRTGPSFYQAVKDSSSIPEELAFFEGALGTVVIELFLVAATMYLAINYPAKNIEKYILAGAIFSFIISIAGNLYMTTESIDMGEKTGKAINLGVAICIGLSAPVNAVLSGYILGVLLEKTKETRQAIWDDYNLTMKQWLSDARSEYESKGNRARYGLNTQKSAQLSAQSSAAFQIPTQLSAQLSVPLSEFRSIESYNGGATEQLLEWLDLHPEAMKFGDKTIKLAAADANIKISDGTISNVMKPIRYFFQNGFSQSDEEIAAILKRKPEVVRQARAVMEKHYENIER